MKVMKKHGEKITSKEIDSMIKQCDVDKDGKINYTGQENISFKHESVNDLYYKT